MGGRLLLRIDNLMSYPRGRKEGGGWRDERYDGVSFILFIIASVYTSGVSDIIQVS